MSFATDLRDILLSALPWLPYIGKFKFRVIKHTSGRLDVEPVTATWLKTIQLRDCWCGLPGCRVQPNLGDEVLLEFIDHDPAQPIITSFAPLAVTKPVHIEIDASGTVDIGGGTKTIHRTGDLADAGTFSAVASPLVWTDPDSALTWQITGAVVGAAVNFTVAAGTGATPGKLRAKALESGSRGRA